MNNKLILFELLNWSELTASFAASFCPRDISLVFFTSMVVYNPQKTRYTIKNMISIPSSIWISALKKLCIEAWKFIPSLSSKQKEEGKSSASKILISLFFLCTVSGFRVQWSQVLPSAFPDISAAATGILYPSSFWSLIYSPPAS